MAWLMIGREGLQTWATDLQPLQLHIASALLSQTIRLYLVAKNICLESVSTWLCANWWFTAVFYHINDDGYQSCRLPANYNATNAYICHC